MDALAGYVATGVVSLAVGILLIYLQPRAKLVYWSPHSFRFDLTKESVVLQTDALTIQNIGRKPAESVELVLGSEPDFFQFSPAITYIEDTTSEGYFVLRIASLGPKEHFTLQLLSYTQVPQFLNLRSRAGQAQQMPFQIQRVYPSWLNFLLVIWLLAGFGFTVYWLIRAIAFISTAIGAA